MPPARPRGVDPSRHAARARTVRVALLVAPVVGVAALVAMLLAGDLVGTLRGGAPVESVAVEDVRLSPNHVQLHLRNDGRVPVTIAQVTVDDAFRPFSARPSTMARLGTATVDVDYPWEPSIPLDIGVLTSTGELVRHHIPAPLPTPVGTPATVGTLTLVGLAMAAVPIGLGLLWLPFLRRASPEVNSAALAFTLGLLTFLLVDTTAEGLDLAGGVGLDGIGLFTVGALGALAVFAAVESGAPRLAWLVAAGIGLHNLGEGLAVGATMRVGEVALGTSLVVAFAIHNVTEGVAVATPLARVPARWWAPLVTTAIAGLPAVPGLWVGGLTASGPWAVLGLGVAAGAIAQVVLAVARQAVGGLGLVTAASFVGGVGLMYLTGLLA
ncbi:ZIP family metal transporter [Actinophytocola oryzae]|uniref:Zinc transporter ZupT n=1 Tax=Actinophytocola oryzae TaxID=502181 RepID=A0A4R7W1M4_9PSEU|nr:metal transporter [Actinophytocola oryzae]TDV56015.1 hypothetical protein CLV71_10276 [Actinophytocola oryzae]